MYSSTQKCESRKSLPPEPVLTRWCSWLVAVQYLAKHHEEILTVVESFSENDTVSIAVAKELLSSSTVIREVFLIKKHFGCLVEAMKKIEADQKLEKVLTVLEFVKINLGDPIAA